MTNILIQSLSKDAETVITMLIFGLIGLGLEVVFTATLDAKKNVQGHLWGYSSLWYLPLYMLAPLFLRLSESTLSVFPILIRGLIYMVTIFTCEFVAMFALRKLLGASPSEANYKLSRWNICGLIRLDFAPAMFLLGLIFEFIYDYIG
ncbi:hypothetical protein BH11CYA1_BH11CYA1_33600 [soil metagenome]